MFRWVSEIFALLYPRRVPCRICGSMGEAHVCAHCLAGLETLEGNTCMRCGRELPLDWKKRFCEECEVTSYCYDRAIACFLYRGVGKALLHRLKYSGDIELVPPLGRCMANKIAQYECPIDCITYVPLYREKQEARGYNQAELLAKEIGAILGIPVKDLLVRVRSTESQYGLGRNARQTNLRNAFGRSPSLFPPGANILLIDDIITTGTTVDLCAGVLKKAGANTVTVLTAANGMIF